MWGKLSCSILMQDWETALEDLNRMHRDIDKAVHLYVTILNMIYVHL